MKMQEFTLYVLLISMVCGTLDAYPGSVQHGAGANKHKIQRRGIQKLLITFTNMNTHIQDVDSLSQRKFVKVVLSILGLSRLVKDYGL